MSRLARVRALPRGFDAEHRRFHGESIFCDHWDPDHGDETCSGESEVEIVAQGGWDSRTQRERLVVVLLCRAHASEIAAQIEDAVKLCDGRDLLEMQGGGS
jgi:hypothetical protein